MLFSLENQRTLDVRVKICTIGMQIDEDSHIFLGVKDGQLLVFSADSIDWVSVSPRIVITCKVYIAQKFGHAMQISNNRYSFL
jgi:hypothetical protein